MDTRLGSAHGLGAHGWLRLLVAAALVLVLTLDASPAMGASRTACKVSNTDSGNSSKTLQAAVNAAKPGARLIVTGTCVGRTVIDKDLTIEGLDTRRTGKATLSGDHRTQVLRIRQRPLPPWRDARVTIRDLTIRDGLADMGGGILNSGSLKLADVVVRDNRADDGGGIVNDFGKLRLNGTTRITGNEASFHGGGIFNQGSLSLYDASTIESNRARWGGGVSNLEKPIWLHDASSIRDNTATRSGGGVSNTQGSVTLDDSSTIRDNTARLTGGGVDDDTNRWDYYSGDITLNDTSAITGNRALVPDSWREVGCGGPRSRAGGVRIASGASPTMTGSSVITDNRAACFAGGLWRIGTTVGVTCGPGGNIYGNSPVDCYFETP